MNHYLLAILGSSAPTLTYASPKAIESGEVVEVELKSRLKKAVVLEKIDPPSFDCKEILRPLEARFSPLQQKIARFISTYYCASLGESFGLFIPFESTPPPPKEAPPLPLLPLSSLQQEALEFLQAKPSALLFGDTGSGKTEIYAHLIATHLSKGKSVLFLMPEISLTPQMERRLCGYFGDWVALWHSKISAKKKQETLEGIASGQIRLIAGARSSLFLPLPNLGLIIVDEEHDDAYKSQNRPRYNARDLALLAGDRGGIQVILGSATPLASTYYRFSQKEAMFRLKGRHFQTQKSLLFTPGLDTLTPPLLQEISKTLKRGKQAIIFLPTRANFKHLLCTQCGESLQCPHCSVSLSLHKKERALICHHCRYSCPIPSLCPKCGAELKSERLGTAQIAEELSLLFPEANIERFDRDLITTQSRLKKTLERFNQGKIDLLVGTQMLSKGHDYHNVELAAILGIDYLLKSDDYRAHERAISTLLQLCGRSGRKESGGVLIQSFHTAFLKDRLGDYEEFLKEELRLRQGLYPPFSKLAMIWFSHTDPSKAQRACQETLERLQKTPVEIIGHGPAPIEKIAKKWRYCIFVRSKSSKILLSSLAKAKGELDEIDIDPLSFV